MSDERAAALKWMRRHADYRYLIDRDLVGWLWPHEHAALLRKLQQRHPERAALVEAHILPAEPLVPKHV